MAIDFSEEMLSEHPDECGVVKAALDFNEANTFARIKDFMPDAIVSASALQWSTNLAWAFERIAALGIPFSLALFTSNTFRTLHETAGIQSPIHSHETILKAAECFGSCDVDTGRYELSFENTRDMLYYIKRSGVSGGDAQLSFTQVRRLIQEYPRDCLEFEVVYLGSR